MMREWRCLRGDELTRGQLVRVMRVMHGERSFDEKVAAYTLILLDIRRKWKRARYWLFRIGDDAKIDIAQTTEFLFKEPTLTQNKFPHIKISQTMRRSVHLYGPKDKLKTSMNKVVRAKKIIAPR